MSPPLPPSQKIGWWIESASLRRFPGVILKTSGAADVVVVARELAGELAGELPLSRSTSQAMRPAATASASTAPRRTRGRLLKARARLAWRGDSGVMPLRLAL